MPKNKRIVKKQKEFRKLNYKAGTGHPTYIYAKVGDTYHYIGITHAPVTQGVKNIPLEENPDPHDRRASYVKPKPGKDNRANFGKRLNGWRFGKADQEKVDGIAGKEKTPRK